MPLDESGAWDRGSSPYPARRRFDSGLRYGSKLVRFMPSRVTSELALSSIEAAYIFPFKP
jgi:hypothetical protein